MIIAGLLWNLPGICVAPCEVSTMATILPPKMHQDGKAGNPITITNKDLEMAFFGLKTRIILTDSIQAVCSFTKNLMQTNFVFWAFLSTMSWDAIDLT